MRPRQRRRGLLVSLTAAVALAGASLAPAGANALDLLTHTPGARYYKVTQATIGKTICVKGCTDTRRPPASYTNALKKQQLAHWGYADKNLSHYDEDHLISLELGGAPRSTRNQWPEPHSQSRKSDPKETAWERQVCKGTLTVRRAQQAELAYKRKFG